MRWCRFQANGRAAHGVIEGDTVTEVTGSPFEDHARTSTTFPLSQVKLLVPVIPLTFMRERWRTRIPFSYATSTCAAVGALPATVVRRMSRGLVSSKRRPRCMV